MYALTSPLNPQEHSNYGSINTSEKAAPLRVLETMQVSLRILQEATLTALDAAKYYSKNVTAYVASWSKRKKMIVACVLLAGVVLVLTLTIYLPIHLKKSPVVTGAQNICDQDPLLEPWLKGVWGMFKNYSQEMAHFKSRCCTPGMKYQISERDVIRIEELRNAIANHSTYWITGSYYSPNSPPFTTEEMPNSSLSINERAYYMVSSSLAASQSNVILSWISQWADLIPYLSFEMFREGLFAAVTALCMRPPQTIEFYLQGLRQFCNCTEQDFSSILTNITNQPNFWPSSSTN